MESSIHLALDFALKAEELKEVKSRIPIHVLKNSLLRRKPLKNNRVNARGTKPSESREATVTLRFHVFETPNTTRLVAIRYVFLGK